MAIEGELRDVSLADLCQLIAMGRKTGCLTVTDRSDFGYVYFEDGRVTYASVLNRPDRFGEVLVRNGVIDRAELSAAMKAQAHRPGVRLGTILLERGSLTREQLAHFVTVLVEEAVYHLFTWEQGSFRFAPGERYDDPGGGRVSISPESLLLEGARRVDELALIQKKIPSSEVVFAVDRVPEEGGEVTLNEAQRRLLPLVDGRRTVTELVEESGLVEFDVMKAVYGLLQAGYLRSVGRREGAVRSGLGVVAAESRGRQHLRLGRAFYRAGMLEDAEREFTSAAENGVGVVEARLRLARIGVRTGRPEAALTHLEGLDSEGERGCEVLRTRAFVLERLGRYPEALTDLEGAFERGVPDPRLRLERGILLFKAGEPRAALSWFRKFRESVPDGEDPPAIYHAYALLAAAAAGELDEAVALGRDGVERHPQSGALLVNLGAVLEHRGDIDAAQAVYLRAVRESPPLPQAHKNLGDLAWGRGDQAGAKAHYERAVRLDPRLGDDVHLKLGTLAHEEGDPERATEFWRKALEINPDNDLARSNLELVSASRRR